MSFVSNNLFEIAAPDGVTVGFAACEEDADQNIHEHLLEVAKRNWITTDAAGLATTKAGLVAWYLREVHHYTVVRVG